LDCTVVTALFATNASFLYLLSWVILQEQFSGIRIMATILSATGISLLAYMDGVSDTQTSGAVLIASCAAAGSSIYKVMFKKMMGEVSFGQVSHCFSIHSLEYPVPGLSLLHHLRRHQHVHSLASCATAILYWRRYSFHLSKITLYLFHISENIQFSKLPWLQRCGSALLSLS
jgi:drug/metabolite transporter (DMT)-like permease